MNNFVNYINNLYSADPPYMQDEKHLVNAMQNCSLTCNEGRDTDVENVLPLNINGAQNGARLQNQGPKNANEVAQFPQKGKQTVNNKGNNKTILIQII